MIIDVWGQHPTLRHIQSPIFDSLRRWTRQAVPQEAPPVSLTVAQMDSAGVDRMLISAWQAPGRDLISNEEVAGFVSEAPERLIGVGSVDISRPMEAVAEVRRCVREYGFKAIRVLPWLCELPPTDR
ncbi:MAG: amidohydrolase, partial [Pseudomonadales bacterium]|nr:amidohydrolase [Pseudomonadales bacterium]